MTPIEVYAILRRKIDTSATGVKDIYKDGSDIVFVMGDGSEIRMEDATQDIIDVAIDEDGYIVITYQDGTTTKSDEPIPNPEEITAQEVAEMWQ